MTRLVPVQFVPLANNGADRAEPLILLKKRNSPKSVASVYLHWEPMRNLRLVQLAAHLTMRIAGKRTKVVLYMVAPRRRMLINAVQWKSPSLFGDRKTSHVPHADEKFSRQQPGAVSVEQPSLRLNRKTPTLLTSELKGKNDFRKSVKPSSGFSSYP
jgi:hypothetical protein